MSKFIEIKFCFLPTTPLEFDKEKFLAGDEKQVELYKVSKKVNKDRLLTYTDITADKTRNYARFVPKGCVFIDFDNEGEALQMCKIILRAKLNCLILKTQHGFHFLFRIPDFYKKEMTGATNWFGYKFDTKGSLTDDIKSQPVQIMRVCGMDREERLSWDWDAGAVVPESINIEELDILPYWLWGKLSSKDLHKEGKPGESTYTLDNTPFTQLMKMIEGERHTHIFSRCRYFAVSNAFTMDEYKKLIHAIHNEYLVKIGTPMPESDLFGDLEETWEEDIQKLESNGWTYDEKERKWIKEKSEKCEKISPQKACEYLYNKYDFYVMGSNYETGEGGQLCYITPDLRISFDLNIMWKELRNTFCKKDFNTMFYKEVKEQLIQRCNEDKKYFHRSDRYYVCKNGIASCIADDIYNFDYLKENDLMPTDLIYDWNLHDRKWVEEHEVDLGKIIKNFIKDLSRDSRGTPQLEVEQWLYVIAGASITPANSLGKIVILSGGGQNGKSLYLAINKMLLSSNFYNESNIFGSSPTGRYWGDGLDKGICCIVDELPQEYNKEAFSYIKGGVSRTASVEINPKYGKKKKIEILPQILCATNHKFELFDKSEGMRRRVVILPCCYKVLDEEKDKLLLYRLVMNLDKSKESYEKIKEYRMVEESSNAGVVIEESGLRIREQCVLDSLENGSLCWFANKARYMYIDYIFGKLKLINSEEMENLFDQTFGDNNKGQCEEFISWYLTNKCGGTDAKTIDLSLANGFYPELYLIYKNEYCKEKKIEPMEEPIFNNNLGRIVRKKFTVKKKKNNKGLSYNYIYFDKPSKSSKKK